MSNLLHQFREFLSARRAKIDSEYRRTLPYGDYISDRWEKAQFLGFGTGTSIYDSSHVFGDVTVGRNTWIGPFTVLDGTGGLAIGSNCSISAGVQIYSHDTVDWATTGGVSEYAYAPTSIGDNCYIGPHSVISKGVTIGDRAIIGANSVVLSDIPAGAKAFGNPARVATKDSNLK